MYTYEDVHLHNKEHLYLSYMVNTSISVKIL